MVHLCTLKFPVYRFRRAQTLSTKIEQVRQNETCPCRSFNFYSDVRDCNEAHSQTLCLARSLRGRCQVCSGTTKFGAPGSIHSTSSCNTTFYSCSQICGLNQKPALRKQWRSSAGMHTDYVSRWQPWPIAPVHCTPQHQAFRVRRCSLKSGKVSCVP